jgi:hypothetical protein
MDSIAPAIAAGDANEANRRIYTARYIREIAHRQLVGAAPDSLEALLATAG